MSMSFIIVKEPSFLMKKSTGLMLASHWSSSFLATEYVSLSKESNDAMARSNSSSLYIHGFCRRSLNVLRESPKEAMFELRKSPTGQQLTAARVDALRVSVELTLEIF